MARKLTGNKPRWVRSPASSVPLHERAKAEKDAADHDARFPVVFSAEMVDRIVAGAQAAGASIPTELDHRQLARDLNCAIFLHRTLDDLAPAQPWAARRRDIEKLAKAARAFAAFWTRDDSAAYWRRRELEARSDHPITGSLRIDNGRVVGDVARVMLDLGDLADRLLDTRVAAGQRDTASSLEQLVGDLLAEIFERHCKMPARINNPARWRRKDDTIGQGEMKGAYLGFVLAVCTEIGIEIEPATIRRALLKRTKKP